MGTRIFPEEPCGVVRVPIRLSRLWRISYQEHGEFGIFYWLLIWPISGWRAKQSGWFKKMMACGELMTSRTWGLQHSIQHIIKLYICTPLLRTVHIILEIPPQGSKSGGYGHSRLDQSRPMYNRDPGDHLILSRSDDSEDHRWCRRWNLTRLIFW